MAAGDAGFIYAVYGINMIKEKKPFPSGDIDYKNDAVSNVAPVENQDEDKEIKQWELIIPWFLTGTSTLVLCAIGWFLS